MTGGLLYIDDISPSGGDETLLGIIADRLANGGACVVATNMIVCWACRSHNKPGNVECHYCGADLVGREDA